MDGQLSPPPEIAANDTRHSKVSAAALGYSAYTVAEFDGANVTLFIFPFPPPGPPGPPPPGAQVQGKVFGMDKYILVPPADCDPLITEESSLCAPCEEDIDFHHEADEGYAQTFCVGVPADA